MMVELKSWIFETSVIIIDA